MRVYFDMDGVLVNLMAGWLPWLNEKTGKNLGHDDVDMWGLENVYGIPFNQIRKPLHKPGFWEKLPPYPGAVEVVEDLHNDGFKIFLATAPFPSDNCAWEKRLWVQNHLPFIDIANLMIIPKKHLLDGEDAALIDDKPENLRWFKGVKILWNQPWNQKLPDGHAEWWYKRMSGWTELRHRLNFIRLYGTH